jgi:hypothetical protein
MGFAAERGGFPSAEMTMDDLGKVRARGIAALAARRFAAALASAVRLSAPKFQP